MSIKPLVVSCCSHLLNLFRGFNNEIESHTLNWLSIITGLYYSKESSSFSFAS